MMTNRLTIGSLCCGIGGIDLGFMQQGFDVAWAVDIDKKACETYNHNFYNKHFAYAINSDITTLLNHKFNFTPVDVIVAGFPCQAFSIAGQQKGFEHEQGNVFFDVCKVIERVQPKVIMLENVKNILSHDKGKTITVILNEIKKLGYQAEYLVMNTSKYSNLPHNRERWYLVAFKDVNDSFNFRFPIPCKEKKLTIQDIVYEAYSVDKRYYGETHRHYEALRQGITKKFVCYQWRRSYLRENKSGVCPTLTANMGKGGGNVPIIDDSYGIRPLILQECLRLQGFPEWYSFPRDEVATTVCYKQIGNSVSVPVISKIAERIKIVLNKGVNHGYL